MVLATPNPYTFHTLQPLPHLPNSTTALSYLTRLRNDAGIQGVMRKHRWSVSILREMEPLGNTDARSKILGRNHGRGELIEIRLRTDEYDGWRAYDMVLKTLYHELAHMVHDDHDRQFWDLMSQIQKEGKQMDWRSGGRPLTDQVFYNPPEKPVETLKGGVFRLGGGGGGGGSANGGGSNGTMGDTQDETKRRREMMARAAEERLKRLTAPTTGKT
ncbi:WLM-domain-containing protein [Ascodesmis nigricans]|uniref:WLM-domain-containing protein n=1 Tax=Ascodesmis nigricans TaxID=341454 RepID=A0A4S2MPB8_9PEZI|nr:WLM-domain-containing protein [Ascodesmis nigricans]